MGKIKDLYRRIYLNILSLRIQLQESTIRTSVEKKLLLEEKAAKLEQGENSDECANAEAQRRILNTCQRIKETSSSEIAYRYKKITDSFVYSSVKNIFKLPRRFMLVSKITVYVSTALTIIETSAFALVFAIVLLLSLPFTFIGYVVYGLTGTRRFKRVSARLSEDSKKGITVLIYSTKDKQKIKNINASSYGTDGRAVLKINDNPTIFAMNAGVDKYGCYYGRMRFWEFVEKKNVLSTDDITVIRL